MKKILLSAACVAAFGASPALAQDGGESPWDISATFGVTSDYMFRGISQTDGDAALQAGFTISHDSGFYLGAWGSNVDFNDGETDFELDWYVGYGGSIDEATSFDINLAYYSYPNAPSGSNYSYFELGAGITYQVDEAASVGLKVAYSPENFGDTNSAFWIGANATFAITEWLSASANVGYQVLDDLAGDDYFHYDVGATLTYGILDIDLRYVGTDLNGNDDKFVGSAIFNF